MNEESNLRKKTFLNFSVLTFSATQILLFTLLPFLSDSLALPLPDIIASFALGTLLFLWGSPYWSAKSDLVGRERVLKIGLMGLGVSFALIVALIEYSSILPPWMTLSILILSRVIYGTMASAIVPVAQLARADMATTGKHLSSMLSHSLALSMGRSLGPLLLLAGFGEFKFLMYALTIWPFILLFIKTGDFSQVSMSSKTTSIHWSSLSDIRLPLVVTILFTIYVGILHSSLGNTLEKVFSLSGMEASILMAKVLLLGSIIMSLTQILAKNLLRNRLRLALYLGLCSLTIGAVLLAFMSKDSELWISISFISAGIAIIQPSHLAIVHELFSGEKIGSHIGILSSGNTIGYAIGGGLTSALLHMNINKLALLFIGLLCLAAFKNSMRVKPC